MKLEDLTGKTAVITGASSGIGEAAARLLAGEGMKLVLVARREERIAALAEELGDAAVAFAADVADAAAVRALFAEVHERFGGLDLLFNNAGVGIWGTFAESDPADWKTQIDANLYGVLNCTHAALPLMEYEKFSLSGAVPGTPLVSSRALISASFVETSSGYSKPTRAMYWVGWDLSWM